MKLLQNAIAAATLVAAVGAQAQVTGALGGGGGSFLSLSSAGLSGGTVATLSGGSVYSTDMSYAALPEGTVGSFLAVGTVSGLTSTLTFAGLGVDYLSFLWGSPDTYNILTVTTTGGVTTTFTTASLGFTTSDGNQSFAQYVQFMATGGSKITAVSFTDQPDTNAFETANFSISPVPEPQTYALLLAGLGAVVFISRRRRN